MARAEKRKYHYIYKITCKITGRFYIGMHSTDDLDDGYFGSGKRLWHSINYHGKENHVKEILEYLPSRQLLKEREKEIVNKDLIGDVMCMNLQEGGGGGFINEEHFNKLMDSYPKSYATRMYRMKNDKDFRNKHIKIATETIKKYNINPRHDKRTFLGKQHTEETKQKMSESSKGIGIGETNSQYGTCWITKNGVNKKIKKEDLDSFIQDGWVKGRKI
jgi:hypothetical protein